MASAGRHLVIKQTMEAKVALINTPHPSDAALTLIRLASEVSASASHVSAWADDPAGHDLLTISSEIAARVEALRAAIAAHVELGLPSLAQLEWRCKVAEDKASRAWTAFEGECSEWHTPEWEAARETYEQAHQSYLQARRELRAHPEWKPKHPKNSRAVATAKKAPNRRR